MGLSWLFQVLLKNFTQFLEGHTKLLKSATEELAKGTPVGQVHYMNSSTESKEEVVARLVRQHQLRDDFSGIVAVDSAEIYGTVEGELTVRKQLVVHATGKLSGKIRYARITVEEGAEISGEISMLDKSPVPMPPRRTGLN